MEVGPFRTVPASQSASGKVELKLVDGGWEEFATMIFGGWFLLSLMLLFCRLMKFCFILRGNGADPLDE